MTSGPARVFSPVRGEGSTWLGPLFFQRKPAFPDIVRKILRLYGTPAKDPDFFQLQSSGPIVDRRSFHQYKLSRASLVVTVTIRPSPDDESEPPIEFSLLIPCTFTFGDVRRFVAQNHFFCAEDDLSLFVSSRTDASDLSSLIEALPITLTFPSDTHGLARFHYESERDHMKVSHDFQLLVKRDGLVGDAMRAFAGMMQTEPHLIKIWEEPEQPLSADSKLNYTTQYFVKPVSETLFVKLMDGFSHKTERFSLFLGRSPSTSRT
jgi:hypothetical protein